MTGTPIGKPREYHMAFNIENGGKAITGVKVTLVRFIEKDMNAKFNLNLVNDPLFPAVFENIAGNARHVADLKHLMETANAAADMLDEYANTLSRQPCEVAAVLRAALRQIGGAE